MTEILAPAGSVSALKSAIFWGADAVYLGLDCFNARIKADNFSLDNIAEYIDLAHLFGVKVYITFNTNVRQNEMSLLEKYVQKCVESKADAFIVTDLGTLGIFRKHDVPLHASTQLGVHNLLGAQLLQKLGFCRVVLARETLEEDIKEIKQNTNLEIEHFVHGALCVSFSGGCLMSSFMSGDSGNRGRCNQPCRLQYSCSIGDGNPHYLLSPADQCLIGKLDRLVELGVDSLKIEGRLKNPHYVGQVVSAYRQVIDKKSKVTADIKSGLLRAFNRGGFSEGYNYCDTKELMSVDVQNNLGEYIGDIVGYKNREIVVKSNQKLCVGDGIKIIDGAKQFGLTVNKVRKDKDKIFVACDKVVNKGKIYITLDSNQVKKYGEVEPKLTIDLSITAVVGQPLSIVAKYKDFECKVVGDVVEQSQKYTVDQDKVRSMVDRLGNTPFALGKVDTTLDENAFIPASAINLLRRQALDGLKSVILQCYESNMQKANFDLTSSCVYQGVEVDKAKPFVEVASLDDLTDYALKNANIVLNLQQIDFKTPQSIINNQVFCNNFDIFINNGYIRLPRVARGIDVGIVTNLVEKLRRHIKGIVCDNLYAVELAKKFGLAKVGGYGLNIYNQDALETMGLDYAIASPELNLGQLKSLQQDKIMVFGYGLVQVMTLSHCPVQLNTGCSCANCKYDGEFRYKDKVASYTVVRYKSGHCYFALHNPSIVDVRGKWEQMPYQCYINAMGLNREQLDGILKDFVQRTGEKSKNSTCGHLFRGVN
ncbi:MAG: U32 family peptidase [Clostridia bacterium]|nr:U32 family peptidase [Clostridia bacterium]MDY4083701.1 U32 family peptidase [Eubacteriales bacterium]